MIAAHPLSTGANSSQAPQPHSRPALRLSTTALAPSTRLRKTGNAALALPLLPERHLHTGSHNPVPAQPGQHQFTIRLLGQPQVRVDGGRAPAISSSDRSVLVLYLLALHRRGITLEMLVDTLMEGADTSSTTTDPKRDEKARTAARTAVWRLRKIHRWIVEGTRDHGGGRNLYFLPQNTSCDLWDFNDKLDSADLIQARSAHDPYMAACAADLRQAALALYRGSFCDGVAETSFIVQADREIAERARRAALKLASYYREIGTELWVARKHGTKGKGAHCACPQHPGMGFDVSQSQMRPEVLAFAWAMEDRLRRSQNTGDKKREEACRGVTDSLGGNAHRPDAPVAHRFSLASAREEAALYTAIESYDRALSIEPYDSRPYLGIMECEAYLGNQQGVQRTWERCVTLFRSELQQEPSPEMCSAYAYCLHLARQ